MQHVRHQYLYEATFRPVDQTVGIGILCRGYWGMQGRTGTKKSAGFTAKPAHSSNGRGAGPGMQIVLGLRNFQRGPNSPQCSKTRWVFAKRSTQRAD